MKLTEDHLVKFGFEQDADCPDGICFWCKDNIYLEANREGFFSIEDGKKVETVEELKEIFLKEGIELKEEHDIRF